MSSPSPEQLRRDYERQLNEVRVQLQHDYEDRLRTAETLQDQLRRDYERQLNEVRASRDRLQRDYEDQLHQLGTAQASQAQLRRDYEDQLHQLGAAQASRDRAESARQTAASALKQKEQECERLVEDHAALQTALEREREQLAAVETARQTAEEALEQKEQAHKRLAEAYAALEQKCAEQLAAATEAHKTHLARQESSHEQGVERLVQALVASLAFGEKQWQQYFGGVGAAPRLPAEIGEILIRPCPFWPNKQVKDTHLLVLMPSRVKRELFNLDSLLEKLILTPGEGGRNTKYRYYHQDVRDMLGSRSCDQAYWVLMTRDVLPRSREMGYRDQKALVAQHTSSTGLPYELPGVLEAATVVLSHYVHSGERLYPDAPWTYTRCRDLFSVGGDDHPTIVGGFNTSGLSISYDTMGLSISCDDFSDDPDDRYGVAGCLRFSRQP